MPRRFVLSLLAAFLAAASMCHARAFTDENLTGILRSPPADRELTVIVRLHDSSPHSVAGRKPPREAFLKNRRSNAARAQEDLRTFLRSHPIRRLSRLWHINGLIVTADAGTIDLLALHPAVRSITADRTVSISQTSYLREEPSDWNIWQINADLLWPLGFTGSQVIVGTMDTGADLENPHLQASYRGGDNSWFDPCGTTSPYDLDGHGTQVLGIILGSNDIDGVISVAPSATWVAAKIFNDEGDASFSDIHLAFQWLLDPDDDPNTDDAPHVVNGSWGLSDHVNQCVAEFEDDVSMLREAGIAVVFAAGNDSVNPDLPSSISPANYPDSLSVGSVDEATAIDSSSGRGPSACDGTIYPKLVAPGVIIETCDLSFGGYIDQHAYVEGTSFAAPHVAAAFALLMQAFPEANNLDIEDALIDSAVDLGEPGPDNSCGNGEIDVYAAYQSLASNYSSADGNHDGSVDIKDLDILAVGWLSPDCSAMSPCLPDFNGDYEVDLLDFSILGSQYSPM